MNIQKQAPFGRVTSPKAKPVKKAKASKPDKPAKGTAKPEKMSGKEYEKELQKLQVELSYLQDWVRDTGAG
jgi:polyphosphate kinase 2 (PPK2 family)